MADHSTIEWTDATWNPVTGCTEVSPGCDHCYAKTFAERWRGTPGHHFERGFDLTLRPERLDQPLRWKKPRRIFVNSMSDLFHVDVPDEFVAEVFAVMALAERHTFQLLTKRHGRMRSLLSNELFQGSVHATCQALVNGAHVRDFTPGWRWPLPNVWLGVSVESQQWADIRIPALLETPAAVRWLSCEPLLGPLDIAPFLTGDCPRCGRDVTTEPCSVIHANMSCDDSAAGIDWVVAGGESGHGARPMHPDWARSLRDQCTAAGVPFLFKQWGEHLPVPVVDDPQFAGGRAFANPRGGRSAASIRYRYERSHRPMRAGDQNGLGVMLDDDTIAVRVGKGKAGRELDGRTWDEFPEVWAGRSREDGAAAGTSNQGGDR